LLRAFCGLRAFRINWLIVGMRVPFQSSTKSKSRTATTTVRANNKGPPVRDRLPRFFLQLIERGDRIASARGCV
jgi:hypothetical protein